VKRRSRRRALAVSGLLALVAPLAAIGAATSVAARAQPSSPHAARAATAPAPVAASDSGAACGAGNVLRAHFYDVGQGLAALVDLPDGHHVLVDTGDSAGRRGCGDACASSEQHLLDRLRADLAGAPIDVLWITHPHSDHVGAAADVLGAFPVRLFVDNGRDPRKPEVARARRAAQEHGVPIRTVDPESTGWPGPAFAGATLTPMVPPQWPHACAHDENECSIGLRVDFCASSVLLTGDAEHAEEATLDGLAPVTLLQVAHHGSATSSSPAFLSKTRPKYAVISVGRPNEGLNTTYCLPRALVVQRLTRVLGGAGLRSLQAFDGDRCDAAGPSDWIAVPTSDHLWATDRDGDVVLTTSGDGTFSRQ
jgi:competence protein ComEC